jgi:hypothetical protein
MRRNEKTVPKMSFASSSAVSALRVTAGTSPLLSALVAELRWMAALVQRLVYMHSAGLDQIWCLHEIGGFCNTELTVAVEYVKGVDGHDALCRESRGELNEQQSTTPGEHKSLPFH